MTVNTQGMGSSEAYNTPWTKKAPKPPFLVWVNNPDGSRGFLEVHRGDQNRYELERDNYEGTVSHTL
jgi:hypothetical protein